MPRFLLICALVGIIGCNRSTAPLASSPAGSYVLTSVDSRPLPAKETAGDSILEGGAVLYDNGSYAINWLAPSSYFGTREEIAVRDTGTWTGAPGQLTFTSSSGANWSASFAEPSLILHLTQDTWTFVKP